MFPVGPASAGPWPRAQGEGFLSFGVGTDGAAQGYLEYGLGRRIVLALGAEHGRGARRLDAALRWHPPDLGPGNGSGIVSGISLGVRHLPHDPIRNRATLSVDIGHGFDMAAGSLWLRAGVQMLMGQGAAARRPEWDLTAQAGLRRGAGIALLGVSHCRNRFGSLTRIRPALGHEVSDRLTVLGEAELTPAGRRVGLTLSLWSRF